MRIARAVIAVVSVVVSLPALGLAAAADDGATPPPGAVRPPAVVLRHVDAARLRVTPAPRPTTRAREVVLLVGGYQSCSCVEDDTFEVLRARLVAAGYDVKRFGQDPEYPYDTFGHVTPSGIHLRDQARSLGTTYSAVHIVAHSMGGVVVDQAFAQGLSSADGVATYVSWASPHSGSDAAIALDIARTVHGSGGALRDALLRLGMEPDSDATRDLATVRAVAPPRGVVRLDLREGSDVLVTERDARDPGVPSRVFSGSLDGHGGILSDPRAIDATVQTIATRRVPPDERSRGLRAAADRQSRDVGTGVLVALAVLTAVVCVGLVERGRIGAVLSLASRFLPPPSRKRCA